MSLKKWIITLCIVVIIAIAGYVVAPQSQHPQKQSVVRIGVLVPLTGKFANYGEDIRNALELAKRDFKSKRGISLELIYEDSAADPKAAIPAAMKLIEIDKVAFIIGGPGSSANLAVAPLFEKNKIPFFSVSNAPKLNNAGEYIFKMLSDIYPENEVMLKELLSQNKKHIALLYDSSSDTQTLGKDYVSKNIEGVGGSILIAEGYNSKTTTDFKSSLTKIKELNPDALYLLSVDKDAGIIVRQARELGISFPLVGWSSLNSSEFFHGAGSSAENTLITDLPFSCSDQDQEKATSYCVEYKNAYNGRDPALFGARAYDALLITASLWTEKSKGNMSDFLRLLPEIDAYRGISGVLDIDKEGNVHDSVFVLRVVKNGSFIKK